MPRRVAFIHPSWAIEGGRITLEGSDFPIDRPQLPEVRVGGVPARVVYASADRISAIVPTGIAEGGDVSVAIEGLEDESARVSIAATFASGLHQVDNPAFDRDSNLYVTYSGTRGQQVPVSIFRVRPDGTRESFSSGVVNPTSAAVGPDGLLYVSSRFEGAVYRVNADGSADPFATDLGVACGLAFAADGTLFVGDRTGTIFQVDQRGRAATFASLPGSVAAFHLAIGPDESVYVTGPTLSSYDSIYQIDRSGHTTKTFGPFGRPQGLAFDANGDLFVVEALAGSSGVYRMTERGPELMLTGPGLIGVAFDPRGGIVVCSNDTAYRLPNACRPLRAAG
jgi:sugar lactone lactonase YvrE